MTHPILNDDWSEYDDHKLRDGRNQLKISCGERWELDYLLRKVKKHFPSVSENAIRVAIATCCANGTPRRREAFLKCIIEQISIFI